MKTRFVLLAVFSAFLFSAASVGQDDANGKRLESLIARGEDLLARGQESEYMGLVELALNDFSEALKLAPDSVVAHRGMQDCLLVLGEKERVIEAYKKLLDAHPDSADYLYLYSRLLDKPKEQYECLVKALELDEKSYWAHYGMALLKYSGAAFKGSIEQLERCIELNPSRPEPYYILIQIYIEHLRNTEKALETCNKAIANTPSPSSAYVAAAEIMQLKGDNDKVIEYYRKAAEASPSSAAYRLQLAEALVGAGKGKDAAEQLRKILDLSPTRTEVARAKSLYDEITAPAGDLTTGQKDRLARIDSYLARRDYGRALAIVDGLVTEDAKSPVFHLYKGMVLSGQEKYDLAMESLKKAVELKPDYARAYQEMALIMVRRDKTAEARELALKAVELNPFLADAQACLAEIYHNEKNYKESFRAAARCYAVQRDYENVRRCLIDQVRLDEDQSPDLTFSVPGCEVRVWRGLAPAAGDVRIIWRMNVLKDGKVVKRFFAETEEKFDEATKEVKEYYYLCEVLDDNNRTRSVSLGDRWLNLPAWQNAVARRISETEPPPEGPGPGRE